MAAEKKLSDRRCAAAKPKAKAYRLSDGGGLFLQVRPDGGRYWQLRYLYGGKERLFQIGPYGEVALERARTARDKQREMLRAGKDPVTERRISKARQVVDTAHTFEPYAQAWMARNAKTWAPAHAERNEGLLRRLVFPAIGNLPLKSIERTMLSRELLKAEARGIAESARRAGALASQVLQAAVIEGVLTFNPLQGISASVPKPAVEHHAALRVEQVGPLLNALVAGERLTPEVTAALLLMLYTALRDHELRGARWKEIDLGAAIWSIPAERMKRREPHTVPLPTQAVEVLEALRPLTYRDVDSFIFASRTKTGYLAENTLRLALHRIGFKVTAHGFRSLVTDCLNELSFRHDWIERQLHHAERNQVVAAYKRTDFFEQRKAMMQFWADYCDRLKAGKNPTEAAGNVVPMFAARAA